MGETALDADTTEVEVVEAPSEDERVVAWRQTCCVQMGFTDEAAAAIAGDSSIDIHLLAGLLEAGCSRDLARRIV